MAFEAHLDEYGRRQAQALAMGGAERLSRMRAAGKLNARERVDYLFDSETFVEIGRFARGERPEDAKRRQVMARSSATAGSRAGRRPWCRMTSP